MGGFTKLFSDIVMSTIWREDDKTRIVWITMLATADAFGHVNASVPGLADAARVSIEDCRNALQKLLSPDPDSRSKEYEGRRIAEIEGGWQILNYAKYREKGRSLDRKEYLRLKQQEHRERVNKCQPCQQVDDSSLSTNVNQCQPIAEAEAEAEQKEKDSLSASLSLEQTNEPLSTAVNQSNQMTPEQRNEYLVEARLGAESRRLAKKAAHDAIVAKRRKLELAGVGNSASPEQWEQG